MRYFVGQRWSWNICYQTRLVGLLPAWAQKKPNRIPRHLSKFHWLCEPLTVDDSPSIISSFLSLSPHFHPTPPSRGFFLLPFWSGKINISRPPEGTEHPDDRPCDRFAKAMYRVSEKGRPGGAMDRCWTFSSCCRFDSYSENCDQKPNIGWKLLRGASSARTPGRPSFDWAVPELGTWGIF